MRTEAINGAGDTGTRPPLARQVALWALDGRYEQMLRPEVLDRARLALLDQLGCQIVGSQLPWTQPALRVMGSFGGPPEASVVGSGDLLPAPAAAYVNAVFGHSAEWDDYQPGVGAHSGSAVVPAALALAERLGASGLTLVSAITLGYDVARLLGAHLGRQLHAAGWHSHAVISTFSVAALAGYLLGLTADEMTNALGIAGSHASGTMEYDQHGGEVKRFHSGIAVHGGLMAAMLANEGLTGPPTIFEGKRGVFAVMADTKAPPELGGDQQTGDGVRYAGLKRFPTTATQQSPIALLADIVSSHDLGKEDVDRIDVQVDRPLAVHIGSLRPPTETIQAQFSLPFSLALRLVHGHNDLEGYRSPEVWQDPTVQRIMARVHVDGVDPVPPADKYACTVTVTTVDGRTYRAEAQHAKGHPRDPLTSTEVESKFAAMTAGHIDLGRSERIIEHVARIENIEDMSVLSAELRSPLKGDRDGRGR